MAVEIKEIVIKAIVSDAQQKEIGDVFENTVTGKDALVQECVNHVLKVLEKKNRR